MQGEGGCSISNPMLVLVNFCLPLFWGEEERVILGMRCLLQWALEWVCTEEWIHPWVQFPLPAHCVSVNTVHEKASLCPSEQGLQLLKAFRQ